MVPAAIRTLALRRHYVGKLRRYIQAAAWESEEPDMAILKHLVMPGDCAIDVGANFGFYTTYLSGLVGDRGHVICFEPVPRTFGLLSHSVRTLKLSNVSLHNAAVSDHDGNGTMEVPQFESGTDNYYQAALSSADMTGERRSHIRVPVRLLRLDSLPPVRGRLTFVKVDVEGHELQVVGGARELIQSHRPALLIEVSGSPDDERSTGFELFRQLNAYGYSPYLFDGERLRSRIFGDTSINYFFLTADHRRHLANSLKLDEAVGRDPAYA
jgi:FkbM family methyltransferase